MPLPVIGGRLHPATVVLGPLRQLVPLAFLAFFGAVTRGGLPSGLLAVLALASLVSAWIRWLAFTWQVTDGALVINQGVLQRRRRVIPLSRIHTIDLARPLLHRLLGVVQVHVETVGGGETEGRLEALATDEATVLRAALLGLVDHSAPTGAEQQAPLAALSLPMLVAAGLTGGRVGVAAALIGFVQQVAGDRVWGVLDDVSGLGIMVALLLAIGVLTAVFALSVIATAISFWGFVLRREGGDLTVRRGLLEQRFDTVPLDRVQAVRIEENLLRRPFGLAVVHVVVAGRAGGDTAAQQAVILPLGTAAQAWRLTEEVLRAPGLAATTLQPMPAAARGRRLRRAMLATVATSAVLTAVFGWTGLAGAASGIVWAALALAGYRALGHARPPGHVVGRAGVVIRRTTVVPTRRVQSTAVRQTIFQRRQGLATLGVHVATTRGSSVTVIDLADATARHDQVDLLATNPGTPQDDRGQVTGPGPGRAA